MRRLLTWAGLSLALAAFVSVVLAATAGRMGRPAGGGPAPSGLPGSPRRGGAGATLAVPVEGVRVQRRTIEQQAVYYGVLEPRATVQLAVRTSGRVARVWVQPGDRVRAGQELLRLETSDLEAQLDQARATLAQAEARYLRLKEGPTPEELEQAEAAVAQAQAQLEAARKELERTELLRQSGAATDQAYDAALSRWQQAQAQWQAARARLDSLKAGPNAHDLEAARAEVERAKAAVRLAQVQLEGARLTAPVTGTVAQVAVDVGEMASPASPAVILVDLEELRVVVRVPGEDVLRLRPGMAVTVQPRAIPDRSFPGRIHRIDPVADAQSHLFGVEVRLANPGQALRAGLDVTVRVPLMRAVDVLAVPEQALARWNEQLGVFVVENGRARFQPVRTGITDGSWRQVVSGLEEGQLVVTSGKELLAPDAPVRLMGGEGGQP